VDPSNGLWCFARKTHACSCAGCRLRAISLLATRFRQLHLHSRRGQRDHATGHASAGSPVPLCEWQLRLGDLFFDLDRGHDQRALDAYRQALDAPAGCLAPEREAATCAWIGAIDRAAGRTAQALALFDRSLAIVPDDTAVLSNRALALEALARPGEARRPGRHRRARRGTPS